MPKVSILMAVYNPDLVWLEKQLTSLNNQTYLDLELIICDDCPEKPTNAEFIHRCITKIPFSIYRNEKNIGSNKTFEYLTTLSSGDYLAYCDHDDIWEPEKIEVLVHSIEKSGSLLVFSDVSIIDSNDNRITNSITKLRKHHVFFEGPNLYTKLLTRNFVIGCTMLIKRDIAIAAIPFVNTLVHDHWLALYASTLGDLGYVDKPLIQYRQHDNNQTGVLSGVHTKKDYLSLRIKHLMNTMDEVSMRFEHDSRVSNQIHLIQDWLLYRSEWWQKFKPAYAVKLWKARRINFRTTVFELIMARLPMPIFTFTISLIRKGKL